MPLFSFQHVANLSKSARLKGRLLEDARLHQMGAVASEGNRSSNTLSPQQQVPCQLPPTPLSPPTPPPPPEPEASPLQMPTTNPLYTERQQSCDIEMTESATLPSISLPPALPNESQTSDDIEILSALRLSIQVPSSGRPMAENCVCKYGLDLHSVFQIHTWWPPCPIDSTCLSQIHNG